MGKKVLIVDDDEDILASIRMLVDKMGLDVKTANNGMKAIEMLKKEKFDLVLLDILMPGMSGREVLKRIRSDSNLKNQKVIFTTVVQLSGAGESIIKELKPSDFIQKPVNVAEFKRKINKVLGE